MSDPKPGFVENQRTLLIDGDTVAFIAAAAVQSTQEDFFGFVKPFANVVQGEACVDTIIQSLYRDLGGHSLQVYLSDPQGSWRLELQGAYKANREQFVEGEAAKVRPLLLGRMKEYLKATYGATYWPGLEADDVLGILMTEPQPYPGERVMVGRDKDFDTIPGLHHQIKKDIDSKGKPVVREVTPEYADWFHLVQSLAGDRVDGYAGCPKVGMTLARQILAEPRELIPEEGRITRGPNKGSTTTKWVKKGSTDPWKTIVSWYVSKGQTEKEALLNARLAHILRHEDYDRETGAVRLWVPK